MARPRTIAIDGPAASGKTVVGKLLAKKLNCRFLDTGIMYRATTWLALDRGIDVNDEEALGRLASGTAIRLRETDDTVVLIDGLELADELRQPEVDRAVSLVAKVPAVRSALVEQQRRIAGEGPAVVVGRDIGTVVLPDADLKVFLEASVSERATRRYMESINQGSRVEYAEILKDLEARDELDTGRAHSPLHLADDAFLLNTDGIGVEQVIKKVLDLVEGN